MSDLSGLPDISTLIDQVIETHRAEVAKYQAGKGGVLGFLVGQVVTLSRGTCDPKAVVVELRQRLLG